MEKWKFGIENDNLVKLVLKKEKTATSYLYRSDYNLPIIGE